VKDNNNTKWHHHVGGCVKVNTCIDNYRRKKMINDLIQKRVVWTCITNDKCRCLNNNKKEKIDKWEISYLI
jgi:hypothetical protein